jgi:hypothetical protein
MPTEYIDCELASGFFEDELYVMLGDSSVIVSRGNVKVEREPQAQKDGRGQVRVYVIERKADRLLVEIPGQPVVGSLRTWIPERHASAIA